jgi:hypothetical protein
MKYRNHNKQRRLRKQKPATGELPPAIRETLRKLQRFALEELARQAAMK